MCCEQLKSRYPNHSDAIPLKPPESDCKGCPSAIGDRLTPEAMRRTLLASVLASAVTSASTNDQIPIDIHEARNGSLIPGDSPIRYCSNPTNDTFKIESIDMYPNPCVM